MMKRRESIRLALSTFLAFALTLLLPCFCIAGSLEPTPEAVDTSGNPVPTMKTLDEIPPVWSQKLRADDGDADGCNSSRFKCVLDGQAVLDKETGLVWERQPYSLNELDWSEAIFWCIRSTIRGGRDGWRLPTIHELASLHEYCPNDQRRLPCGHPFIGIGDDYWSATSVNLFPDQAYYFSVVWGNGRDPQTSRKRNWCVRGGFGINYEGY